MLTQSSQRGMGDARRFLRVLIRKGHQAQKNIGDPLCSSVWSMPPLREEEIGKAIEARVQADELEQRIGCQCPAISGAEQRPESLREMFGSRRARREDTASPERRALRWKAGANRSACSQACGPTWIGPWSRSLRRLERRGPRKLEPARLAEQERLGGSHRPPEPAGALRPLPARTANQPTGPASGPLPRRGALQRALETSPPGKTGTRPELETSGICIRWSTRWPDCGQIHLLPPFLRPRTPPTQARDSKPL